MDHTFIGDLTFRLTPPDGSPTVAFQARRGGTRENICLSTLDDDGGFPNISTLTSVTGQPQVGDFSPETTGMLSMFDGESINGDWTLNVSDNASIDTGSMRRFSLVISGTCDTTAAGATVSGRVLTPDGYGLRNAIVTITDSTGMIRQTRTSSFGYYAFEGIEVGGTYVLSVGSKRYTFTPRTLTVNDDVADFDFIGQGSE
jgi:subtilisin-like proprotein convertase family protein